jgi:hypothetical protein
MLGINAALSATQAGNITSAFKLLQDISHQRLSNISRHINALR